MPAANAFDSFRDPERARLLAEALHRATARVGRDPVSVMHVCGSHEQAIARYGLRANFPDALDVVMGPGCPVCITDMPEVDEAVALAKQGVRVATYGDMLRVPGTAMSLGDAQAAGAKVDVVYSVAQAVERARHTDEEVVFFATGFETTAVATAAVLLDAPPKNFSVLSAHKYIPPVMEIVSEMPGSRIEGFLAAGHAATITGWGVFEPFVAEHGIPVVVAGFEPLDILAGLVKLVELVADGRPEVVNMYPRCVTREGNAPRAGEAVAGVPPDGRALARHRARAERQPAPARRARPRRRAPALRRSISRALWASAPSALAAQCICGDIMSGVASPHQCALFGKECVPDSPVGACMVSQRGHLPNLAPVRRRTPICGG